MWNSVLYVSCQLYCIIFLRSTSWLVAGCCLISGMWDNHWNILAELISRLIPSSGTGFPGCGHKMKAPTASPVPHLWFRRTWDDPRCGHQSCRGDQFSSQSDILEPDSTVCRRAYWEFVCADLLARVSPWPGWPAVCDGDCRCVCCIPVPLGIY